LTNERPFRNAQGLDPRNNFLAESLRHHRRPYFPPAPTAPMSRGLGKAVNVDQAWPPLPLR
jgi:hypothetical protein